MNFEYDRLSKEEQELFRTSFESAWVKREDAYFGFDYKQRQKRKEELKAMRNSYGYQDPIVNAAWEGYFIVREANFKNERDITKFVAQFNDVSDCKEIIRITNEKIDSINAQEREEYWIVTAEKKIAAFKTYPEVAKFISDFNQLLIDKNKTDYILRMSIYQAELTTNQVNELFQKNHNNDVEYIIEKCWEW